MENEPLYSQLFPCEIRQVIAQYLHLYTANTVRSVDKRQDLNNLSW